MNSLIRFNNCPTPTIGVEVELQIVDKDSMDLYPGAPKILDKFKDNIKVKEELLSSIIEITTGICNDAKEVRSDLSKTLNRIALIGWQEFYNGETANLIEKCMNRTGGIITKSDLKNYKAKVRNAIEINYRDYLIYSMPPASSGGIAIAGILNQLENINFSDISYHSAEHIHYVSEVERRVYSDRAEFLGDIDFIPVPIETLISDSYARERWNTIDANIASVSTNINHGEIPFKYKESEETTHYSVVDKWGNAVSVTTTINGWYGSGIVVEGNIGWNTQLYVVTIRSKGGGS